MTFGSTRGMSKGYSFSDAVLRGIAPDGGLFIPDEFHVYDSFELSELSTLDYKSLACEIFKHYATDFTAEEIRSCVDKAYTGLDVKLTSVNGYLNVLELWHGPTAAFKDMALQILPEFMSVALKKSNRHDKIAILTATSGDTGSAALKGFKDVDNIKLMVFYPVNGVSEMQKRQMVTQEGSNLNVVAVEGNFDDAQTGVKNIFANYEFSQKMAERGYSLSSANSINIGRLLPQVVYYFYAYFLMCKKGAVTFGSKINFAVPTGNFGNILACYYAKKCGLPVNRIICATNDNNVVSEFMTTGTYNANRKFMETISPAMDILISSNLERLLYDMTGEDSAFVTDLMLSLKNQGVYSADKKTMSNINAHFWSSYATQDDCIRTIKSVYERYGYLIDPHTSVGFDVYDKYVISTGDTTKTVTVSTASPFKFNKTVSDSIFGKNDTASMNEFEILEYLSAKTGNPIPWPLKDLDKKTVLHKKICKKNDMIEEVDEFCSK